MKCFDIFEHHKRSGTADKIKKFRQDPLGDLYSPRPCTNSLGNPSPHSLLYYVMVQPILSSTQSPESVPPSIVERKGDNSLAPLLLGNMYSGFLYTQGLFYTPKVVDQSRSGMHETCFIIIHDPTMGPGLELNQGPLYQQTSVLRLSSIVDAYIFSVWEVMSGNMSALPHPNPLLMYYYHLSLVYRALFILCVVSLAFWMFHSSFGCFLAF